MWYDFFSHFRTKISRLLGILFLIAFIFSDKILEIQEHLLIRVMFIIGCFFVSFATIGRLWCAQYIAGYKDNKLVSEGPYSISRNPLYFFSLVGSIGVGFCSESLILTIVILLGFVIIYPVTIFNEERKLSAKFGAAYADYVQKVPRFFPKFSLFHEPPVYTIKTKAYRRVIFESMFFIWVVVLFEIFKVLTDLGIIVPLFSIY